MLLLNRIESKYLDLEQGDRQFGVMLVDGTPLCSLERPWLPSGEFPDGEPMESCVPAGLYNIIKEFSPKYGKGMYYLINEDIGIYLRKEDRQEEWQRWGCMLHPANWVKQINGCVALGKQIKYIDHDIGVSSSGASIKILYDYLDKQTKPQMLISWT